MWKTLDKLEQIYLIGFKAKIYMTIEDFNALLTDDRIHFGDPRALELTQTSAEISATGIYGKYKDMIEIHIIKKGKV